MNIENNSGSKNDQEVDVSSLRMQFQAIFLEQEQHYIRLLKDLVPFLQEAKDTIDNLSKIKRPISETLEHLIEAIQIETNETEKA